MDQSGKINTCRFRYTHHISLVRVLISIFGPMPRHAHKQAPEAKAELARWGVKALPNWPPYSPDMNPQENVWPWIEKNVRKIEARDDTFANFKNKLQRVHSRYPNAESLVASMPKRIAECIERKGAMTKR